MITILVGAVVMFAIGALWFTVLFGKIWSRLAGRTREEMDRQGPMKWNMAIMFVMNIISVGVMYYMLPDYRGFSYFIYAFSIILIWVAFTLPSLLNTYLWEGKSVKLVLINAGGSLAGFLAASVVVFLLK